MLVDGHDDQKIGASSVDKGVNVYENWTPDQSSVCITQRNAECLSWDPFFDRGIALAKI